MKKSYIIVSAIVIIVIVLLFLGSLFVKNERKYVEDVTGIHYADIEMTLNGRDKDKDKVQEYKQRFLNVMKKHIKTEDITSFTTNFETSFDSNVTKEWEKIDKNEIDTYTVFDAIGYNKFEKIFSRVSEVVDGHRYLFVIVTASSNGINKYSYIYPYKFMDGNYVLDYFALYKISLINHDFKVSSRGAELINLKNKTFDF